MTRRYNLNISALSLVFLLLSGCSDFFASTTFAHSHQNAGFLFTRQRGQCTAQYWSRRKEQWPTMVPIRSTVSRVFGSRASERYASDLTLFEATSLNENGNDNENEDDDHAVYIGLLKQSTAALLNSYTRLGFPFRPWEVKTRLIRALVSETAAARQAQVFLEANNACI